jgi:ferredoxin
VAIVGAGPTGLSAAYYLQQEGHLCILFEKQESTGGRLRTEPSEEELPAAVLDAEVAQIFRLGAELKPNTQVVDLDDLSKQFDAVLLACGQAPAEMIDGWGVKSTPRGIEIDKDTLLTSRQGVFAAGSAIRRKSLVVRSVADGKLAALAIHQYVSGMPITTPEKPFSSRIGKIQSAEAEHLAQAAGHAERQLPQLDSEYSADEAAEQSDRCLSCGCISHGSCKLERYAIEYGVDPTRYAGERKPVEVIQRPGGIRFEPQKCIKCELCIQIAAAASEPLGLTFVGRGFDVQLAVPFDHSLDEGMSQTVAACVAACPTGALSKAENRM